MAHRFPRLKFVCVEGGVSWLVPLMWRLDKNFKALRSDTPLREGDKVIVHFRNNLPEPTTVHWHGIHLPAESDGSPFYPIAPGQSHDYVFTVRPGTAGTYWYHPHPDRRTGYAIGKGLFGAIIVHAADDPLPMVLGPFVAARLLTTRTLAGRPL